MEEKEETAPYQDKYLRTFGDFFIRCTPCRLPECPFFASKLFPLERTTYLCFETLPREVFLCFAGFVWANLLCFRTETG